jgi:hypothetical protein
MKNRGKSISLGAPDVCSSPQSHQSHFGLKAKEDFMKPTARFSRWLSIRLGIFLLSSFSSYAGGAEEIPSLSQLKVVLVTKLRSF